MNNPKLIIDIHKSENVFISLEGEYFFGETQRCLYGDWNLSIKEDKIYLEDDKEIIIADKKTELVPRIWADSFFVVKETGKVVNEKYYYRGAIVLDIVESEILVYNKVDVEFFISSVLDRRFFANDQKEFLKAMVIIYRSYIMKNLNELNTNSFIKEKTHQELLLYVNNFISPNPKQLEFKYKGISIEGNEVLRKAVEDTEGEVLFYNSQIVALPYTFCCGGIPEDSYYKGDQECKDQLNDIKDTDTIVKSLPFENEDFEKWIYNPGEYKCKTKDSTLIENFITEDIGDRNMLFRWKVAVKKSVVIDVLCKHFDFCFDDFQELIVIERSLKGSVKTLIIKSGENTIELSKNELMYFAALIKLPSLTFVSKIDGQSSGKNDQIVFVGAGRGHRAGLCMVGAMAMAKEGKSVKDLINHYYLNVYIAKQY